MASINYPTNIKAPAYPFECEYEDNSIISKFEDGSQQSRRKFTRSRRKWTLHYNNIPRADYLVLMNFISQTVSFSALSFNWVNTDSIDDANPETVEARITNVGKWTNDAMHYWSGSIELTEV